MSHFLTLVLVSADESDPAQKAEQLMRPYFADDLEEAAAQSKFDAYTIGGRFDGKLWGKQQHYSLTPDEFQKRYGLDVVKPEDNIRPVSALVPDLVPYAVITPDVCWHDGTHIHQKRSVETGPRRLADIKSRLWPKQSRFQQEEPISAGRADLD